MTLHVPTHPAGLAGHHYLRSALLLVGAAALALLLWGAALVLRPTTEPAAEPMTPAERMIEFRAGERALWQNPVQTESERMIEFRAGERALWNSP